MNASTLLLFLALGTGPRVAVIDTSVPDAIYEDISRGLANGLVKELTGAGLEAFRVDSREMSVEDCRVGPCLGVVAKEQKAQVIITLDATELDKDTVQVVVTAMAGRNGMPLAGGRYEVRFGRKKKPQGLVDFVEKLVAVAAKFPRPPDAGVAAP